MAPQEEFQKLKSHIPLEDLDYDPEHPPALYVSNVIRRVIVSLFAEVAGSLVRLEATAAKELKTHDTDALAALVVLAGYLDGVETLIGATNTALAGTIVVSADAQIPDKWDATTGTAGDAYGGYVAFGFISKVVTIIATANPLDIMLKDGAGAAGDVMHIPADMGISLDLKTTEYRVKNHTGGSNCIYVVIASGLA